jgi:hypothetical protein
MTSAERLREAAEVRCRACTARHHERCTGWTNQYATTDTGALALIRCECERCTGEAKS